MTTRRGLLGAAAAAATLPLPALAQAAPLRDLRIGYQKNGLLHIDKQRGLIEARFRAWSVAVRWVEFTFGPPLLEALSVGSIDYGAVGDAPPVFAQAAGAKLLHVAAQEAAGSGRAIELARTARRAGENRPGVARLLSEASGIAFDAWERVVARAEFAVGPMAAAVVEEQQRIAGRFHRLGPVPRQIAVRDVVWQWRPQA